MQKKLTIWAFLTASAMVLTASCTLGLPKSEQKDTYQPVTRAGASYQSSLQAMEESVERLSSCLAQYLDLGESSQVSRNAQNELELNLGDLEELITDELMASHRLHTNNRMDSSGRTIDNGTDTEEVTLEQELKEIVIDFTETLQTLVPDTTRLTEVPGLSVNDGNLVMYGESELPLASLPGIIAVEILNAQLEGQDIDQVLADLGYVEEDFFEDETAGDRGIYPTKTPRWSDKTIRYYWDESVTDLMKTDITAAMDDWEAKVPGIQFREANIVVKTMAQLMLLSVLNIEGKELNNAAGRATVGCWPGLMTYQINPEIYTYSDPSPFRIRVPRHELGHVLGLIHEHQRWDRDEYLSYDSSYVKGNDDWTVQDEFFHTGVFYLQTEWRTKRVKVLWGRITVSYPVFTWKEIKSRTAEASTEFDYQSIMLYPNSPENNLRAKKTLQGLKAGQKIPYNRDITAIDAAMVKKRYGL